VDGMTPLHFWYLGESLKALTPVVIGAVAAYIALRQWSTSHAKLKLDLFDRRLEIYRAVAKPLESIGSMKGVSNEDYFGLMRAFGEAEFLFPQPVLDFMRTILDLSRNHRIVQHQIDRAMEVEDSEKINKLDKEQSELEEKIENEFPKAMKIFRPFLDFRAIKKIKFKLTHYRNSGKLDKPEQNTRKWRTVATFPRFHVARPDSGGPRPSS
jgi:hypothetical protein